METNKIENVNELINSFIVETSEQSGKTQIEKLLSIDSSHDFTKFYNLIELGNVLKNSVEWFENIGATLFKEKTGVKLNKADYFTLFFNMKKAWCYRLIQAANVAPSVRSNYLEGTKNPTIDGLVQFVNPPKKQGEKSEILITFGEHQLKKAKDKVTSTLTIDDINKLINELQTLKAKMEQ